MSGASQPERMELDDVKRVIENMYDRYQDDANRFILDGDVVMAQYAHGFLDALREIARRLSLVEC